jgi:hypothetical protein
MHINLFFIILKKEGEKHKRCFCRAQIYKRAISDAAFCRIVFDAYNVCALEIKRKQAPRVKFCACGLAGA